ncbi:bifunctional 2-C-methyl-D-erythritol 4-phosphate cytidylyltransferase/2-C-methyl-D-erythritol 2,4-cyclodiphosphate synthase [Sphingomonas sp. ID1715]|uniref:bifunctional 2-C-methyl-D-erythritol 4-phosphate cytidylyltransferase/2-C-methyl-D-erythritol 2,4-cyclodiphosphate synthase n=1 Tax=Sphingomonas sp. ID1715 TaxID=1656898 RepID=UPI001489F44B|nr:bifunctional 2-C-methyl-D-erythritol 4-phosphate cytidylyltransferase/2-C-methyl-D-erythritol 2,4-cyclodiphosphate synthase [Sphingomonas sp. ID1715]
MSKTVALIVAAGQGTRAGGGVPKQFRRLAGKALVAHAYDGLVAHPDVSGVVVVTGEDQRGMLEEALAGRALLATAPGGATRRLSVLTGLEAIGHAERVLIHDAARPFVPAEVIDRLLSALNDHQGAVPVLPVADTLAQSGEMLGEVVNRSALLRVQTPQAFRVEAIRAAHASWTNESEPTDDAQMLRAVGYEVATILGDVRLEKITQAQDFAAAEARLGQRIFRTGMGLDVHRLAEGEELWLGGLLIPHDKGLAGHSDADVALHALTDALLGAVGAGDIGQHFPPSDSRWRGASSDRFLQHAAALVAQAGARIEHVDLTIVCEAPKIGPQRDAMRARIAELLALPLPRVSVKATTTERLGFTGRGEGISAQAVATVSQYEVSP